VNVLPVFLIGVSVCWYALRADELLRRPSPSRLQRLLGCIFVWWCLSTLKDLFIYIPGVDAGQALWHIFFVDGCGAVTFALFIFELTMPGWVTRRRTAWMLMPFVVFFVLHFFLHGSWFFTLFTAFFVAFAWVTFFIAIIKGRSYAKAIRQNYSDLQDVDISWMGYIMVAFFVCQHIWWAVSSSLDALADSFYYASSLVCWHFTLRGVNRLRSVRLPEEESSIPITPDENKLSGGEETAGKTGSTSLSACQKRLSLLDGRLEQLMDDEQLYLNPDLTMLELCARLRTNRTYLSEYLSIRLNTTFYDYVNRLRIERCAIPMMKSQPDVSLDYIAAQSGFKSMTTFRRAFRKVTGQLPSDYMRQ